MSYATLRIREQPGVRFVQLYRPEAQNAINDQLLNELSAELDALENDMHTNVVVLEGLPHVFCSGMDFQEYAAAESDQHLHMANAFALLRRLSESSKITVAKVQGKVNAGGIGIVAASDLVIAQTDSSFAFSELLFGLLPAVVLPFLHRRIGYPKAKLLALSTQPIDAVEAHRWGLADVCGADTEQLLQPFLQRWRRLTPMSIRRLKQYMNQLQSINSVTQTLAVATISELMSDPGVKAGIRRYVEEGIAPWRS